MTAVDVPGLEAPRRVVLEDVNWSVADGEFWVVGGPPDSGKTALLTAAAGLSRPQRGTHQLFGRDLSQLREDELAHTRRRVGFIFGEGGRLFNPMTIAENVALPVCYHRDCAHREAEDRVRQVIAFTDLERVAHRTPGQINRNLRLRAALARALALGPDLLLLDNPLAALDPRETRWWLDRLDALSRGHEVLEHRRVTLVAVTDDLRPWRERGEQFAVLEQRRLAPLGGRTALAESRNPVLRELLADG